jgi:hypothetical protein
MSTFPNSPRLLKCGLVLIDMQTQQPQRTIVLQYNPDSLSRTLQIQAVGENASRSEALRLKGPPVETIKLEAEIDVTDQLEFPDKNPAESQLGLFPILSALETMIYPTSKAISDNNTLAGRGTLEIAPMEAPLTVFVWSQNRIAPVRLTDFSVTEEAFDPNLNPIRAKVSLGMRVLTVNDVGFDHRGGSLFMVYLKNKETLAQMHGAGSLGPLGITRIP